MHKKARQYEIKTVADFLKVPADRLTDCLAEFKICVDLASAHAGVTQALGRSMFNIEATSVLNGFVWIDDGEGNVSIVLDAEEAAL